MEKNINLAEGETDNISEKSNEICQDITECKNFAVELSEKVIRGEMTDEEAINILTEKYKQEEFFDAKV